MTIKKLRIIFLTITMLAIECFADTITSTIPAMMSVIPNKTIFGIDYITKQNPSIEYNGKVKTVAGSYVNTSFSSNANAQNSTLVYALSPWIDANRFAFVAKPSIAENYATSQTNPYATALSQSYSNTYNTYSLNWCRKVTNELYLALTGNLVQQEASQSYAFGNMYNFSVSGSGSGVSGGASFSYLSHIGLNLYGAFQTQTNITLQGNGGGFYGAYNNIAPVSLNTILPMEATLGVQQLLDSNYGLQASVKKRWWSAYKTQNLNISDRFFETLVGQPITTGYKDAIGANILAFYNGGIFSGFVSAGLSTAVNSPNYATLTSNSFGSKSLMCSLTSKITQNLFIGINANHIWANGSYVNSASLQGNIGSSQYNVIGLFSKVEF